MLCWVTRKDDPKLRELQCIKLPDRILVGVDVWRILDRVDYPSYEIEEFKDEREVKRKYFFRKIRKGYFMDNPDAEERRSEYGLL